jgi:hypothetical protein
MSPDATPPAGRPADVARLEDLPARPADKAGVTARQSGGSGVPVVPAAAGTDDDVIRIEDLTPRENVKGGRKVILGEVATRPEDSR